MPSANQSESLRDSTDFETQLYLCNEAFKVWTLTPFNYSKTSYKIPHIRKPNFEAEHEQNVKTLPLKILLLEQINSISHHQWLDWQTYHRLFSSAALPAYLLFVLLVICALLRDTIQRWRTPKTPAITVGPSENHLRFQ